MKVLDEEKTKDAIKKLAEQIYSFYKDYKNKTRSELPNLAAIGIKTGGDILAYRLSDILSDMGLPILQRGSLDIALYRDDLEIRGSKIRVEKTDINFDINNYEIILVDDVIHTGRTIRAALDALMDLGRPQAVRLAVLVDRNQRLLPIQPDFVGIKMDEPTNYVQVKLKELDGEECIIIGREKAG